MLHRLAITAALLVTPALADPCEAPLPANHATFGGLAGAVVKCSGGE